MLTFLFYTNQRCINLKHPLVASLVNDSSKTLCLVMGVVRLKEEGSISGKTDIKGSEEVKAVAVSGYL